MSTNTKHSYKLSVKRATRRRRRQQQQHKRRISSTSIGSTSSLKSMEDNCHNNNNKSKVSQKLQALKNLIPTHNGNIVKPDQLFKEAADYIVLLRNRVLILQKLVEYYGNNNTENENVVLL